MQLRWVLLAILLAIPPGPAMGCDVAVPTPGVLALSSDGQSLSSANPGGLASVVVISDLALFATTTITISNTRLDVAPGGFAAPVTYAATYSASWLAGSASGSLASNSSFTVLPLVSLAVTITLHNTVTSSTGFRQGSYTTKTTIQCT